jgi:AraC-like DNA-binding protein
MPAPLQRPVVSLRIEPAPPLDAFVASIWYWEGSPQSHARELVVAEPGAGMLIDLDAQRGRSYTGPGYAELREVKGISVCGPRTSPIAIDAFQPRLLGVQFRPGGVYPFLRVPTRELRDAHVALDDLWRTEASDLLEQLGEAPTPRAKLQVMERTLLRAARRSRQRSPAIDFALQAFRRERVRVADVAADLSLSPRRFIDAFEAHVGVTPKRYLRLKRFQRLLGDLWQTPHGARVDWADLALAHTYSDQSHLIREFHELAGVTPTVYLARRGPGLGHVLWS